jgi:hypothetical protein
MVVSSRIDQAGTKLHKVDFTFTGPMTEKQTCYWDVRDDGLYCFRSSRDENPAFVIRFPLNVDDEWTATTDPMDYSGAAGEETRYWAEAIVDVPTDAGSVKAIRVLAGPPGATLEASRSDYYLVAPGIGLVGFRMHIDGMLFEFELNGFKPAR